MNDADFPVADVLRRHRRRASAPASARSRSTWSSSAAPTTTRSCRWRATSAARGVVLRFIEYMDVGATNGWRMDEVLPSAEVMRAHRRGVPAASRSPPTRPARPPSAGATPTAAGEIGVISSVTQAFCRDCNRARLSTEGKLFLCLFASRGHDLRALLRGGASDDADRRGDRPRSGSGRDDRYSELRSARARRRRRGERRVEMHYIGG